ncbi:MAG: SRPBCC domain-containing protein [Cyanobacteria bacterium J06638_28]
MSPKTQNRPSLRRRLALMPGWSTEVVINATSERVWEQVTYFEGYSEWNSFVIEAQAEFAIGKQIGFLEDLKQFGQHWITAEFLEINLQSSFVWQGCFLAPDFFTVRHYFEIRALSERQTQFRQIH